MNCSKRVPSNRVRRFWIGLSIISIGLVHCGLNPQPEEPSLNGTDTGSNEPSNGGSPGVLGEKGASTGGARSSSASNGTTGTIADNSGPSGDVSGLAPEQKNTLFEAPVLTGKILWSPNPQSGRVAVMDAETLEMQTFSAGYTPKYLVSVPNEAGIDSVIVLNTGSHDATWFRLPQGLAGAPETITIPTHQDANSWAVSPSGRWAVAWTDARQFANSVPTQQFQDVTVIDLGPRTANQRSTILTVGSRPSSVSFDAREERVLAVVTEGISVIELATGDRQLVPVDDGLADPATRDVVITPDGSTALVRHEGNSVLGIVDLTSGQRGTLDLPAPVTDLDLDKTGQLALAVLRDRAEVMVLELRAGTLQPLTQSISVPGEVIGSAALADDGSVAVLYTTAEDNDHVTTLVLDQSSGTTSQRTVSVQAPVRSMIVAPDARNAVAFLGVSKESNVKGAFALIPTQVSVSPKIVAAGAEPTSVAMAPGPNSDRALITVLDDATQTYGVYIAKLPSLEVNLVSLASPPLATGIVPSVRKGYVAQSHPEGQITIIQLDDGTAQTITGFELAAKVRY